MMPAIAHRLRKGHREISNIHQLILEDRWQLKSNWGTAHTLNHPTDGTPGWQFIAGLSFKPQWYGFEASVYPSRPLLSACFWIACSFMEISLTLYLILRRSDDLSWIAPHPCPHILSQRNASGDGKRMILLLYYAICEQNWKVFAGFASHGSKKKFFH